MVQQGTYDPTVLEKKWQDYWEKHKIYSFDPKKKNINSNDTPPPYASADHLQDGQRKHYTHFEFKERNQRMRANNELTKEEFAPQKEIVVQEQARVRSLIKDNEDTSKNWLEPVEDFINTAFYARDWFNKGDLEDRRELVYKLGARLSSVSSFNILEIIY